MHAAAETIGHNYSESAYGQCYSQALRELGAKLGRVGASGTCHAFFFGSPYVKLTQQQVDYFGTKGYEGYVEGNLFPRIQAAEAAWVADTTGAVKAATHKWFVDLNKECEAKSQTWLKQAADILVKFKRGEVFLTLETGALAETVRVLCSTYIDCLTEDVKVCNMTAYFHYHLEKTADALNTNNRRINPANLLMIPHPTRPETAIRALAIEHGGDDALFKELESREVVNLPGLLKITCIRKVNPTLAQQLESHLAEWGWCSEKDIEMEQRKGGEDLGQQANDVMKSFMACLRGVRGERNVKFSALATSQKSLSDAKSATAESAKLQDNSVVQAFTTAVRESFGGDPTCEERILDHERALVGLKAKEQMHIAYAKISLALKIALLELGQRWVDIGVLKQRHDIFDLTTQAVDRLCQQMYTADTEEAKSDAARAIIHEVYVAKTVRALFKNYEPPSLLGQSFKNVGNSKAQEIAELGKASMIKGKPVSSGRGLVEGPACIVRSIDEADKVKDGDILVVDITGPAWTPLFNRIRGLIMCRGGPLSHGAVIAKEFDCPAISNVKAATSIFKDGEVLVIDGNMGTIFRRDVQDSRAINTATVSPSPQKKARKA